MKIYFILLLISVASIINAKEDLTHTILEKMIDSKADSKTIFATWHLLFKKDYSLEGTEAITRFKTFNHNFKKMLIHNSNKASTWKMGLNLFSDLTEEEFRLKHTTFLDVDTQYSGPPYNLNGFYKTSELQVAADNEDFHWEDQDWTSYCGKVFYQQSCGCCYAFATANAIECNYNIATGKLLELSRQQIVDCNALTNGCNGGNAVSSSIYSKSQGLMLASDYPFTGKVGVCAYNQDKADSSYLEGLRGVGADYPSSFSSNPFSSSRNLYEMLQKGTMYISIDATPIMSYKSGIIDLTGCTGSNHAVLLVGYKWDSATNTPYWIIKNSWDTWWGEQGYIRVRVKDDSSYNCFINRSPYQPIAPSV